MNRIDAWADKRPIFLGLPEYGYQDNEPTDWLTSWVDEECVAAYEAVRNLYSLSDPHLCPIEHLDTLAWLVGLSGDYWDVSWSEQVKRDMINNAKWLFDNVGTLAAVEKVLQIHGIPYRIWTSTSLYLPFTFPATFGKGELRYLVQLPISIVRDGKVWKEAERTIKNYSPAIVLARAEYQGFILGFSRLGDSIFYSSL
jgi:phage tail P2-like protein